MGMYIQHLCSPCVNSMTCIIYNYYVKLYLNTDIVGNLSVIKFVVISTISDKQVPRLSSNKHLQYSVNLRCSAHYLWSSYVHTHTSVYMPLIPYTHVATKMLRKMWYPRHRHNVKTCRWNFLIRQSDSSSLSAIIMISPVSLPC